MHMHMPNRRSSEDDEVEYKHPKKKRKKREEEEEERKKTKKRKQGRRKGSKSDEPFETWGSAPNPAPASPFSLAGIEKSEKRTKNRRGGKEKEEKRESWRCFRRAGNRPFEDLHASPSETALSPESPTISSEQGKGHAHAHAEPSK